jgi:hypothetical protein
VGDGGGGFGGRDCGAEPEHLRCDALQKGLKMKLDIVDTLFLDE